MLENCKKIAYKFFVSHAKAEEIQSAFENTSAMEKSGKLKLIRLNERKKRYSYRLELNGGEDAFLKIGKIHPIKGLYRCPFREEAKVTVMARRRGICVPTVLGFGAQFTDAWNGKGFIATEWLTDWQLLSDTLGMVERKPSSVPRSFKEDYPLTIARLIADLHIKGFMHRDLQPAHIFWRERESQLEWCLVDLDGAFCVDVLPDWYRIKSLYSVGRHIIDSSVEETHSFLSEYIRLTGRDIDGKELIKEVLEYALFREEGRKLERKLKSLPAILKFGWKHKKIAWMRIKKSL